MQYPVVKDRVHAGQMLANLDRLKSLSAEGPVYVLGLPRGGVPLAFE